MLRFFPFKSFELIFHNDFTIEYKEKAAAYYDIIADMQHMAKNPQLMEEYAMTNACFRHCFEKLRLRALENEMDLQWWRMLRFMLKTDAQNIQLEK